MISTYRTVQGDTWDYIAYKTMGSERYMNQLVEANTLHRDTSVFDANIVLVIPAVTGQASELLPPWKR